MRIELRILTASAAAVLVAAAIAAPLPPETTVIVDGPIKVDAADVDGYMLRVPENRRAEVRASRERVATIADNLFLARTLAARARDAGLDKDVAVQRRLQQVQDALLADLYVQHVEKTAPQVNLEQRARELYIGDPSRFVSQEQVHVQHILIGLIGRTREMAEARAREIHAEVKSGKEEFLALAARLSDDPDKKRNGGEMGYNSPTSFVAPLAKRIASMKTKGEVSEPVESHQGFHIVKFIDRKPTETRKFEDVKKGIIAEEKERLAKQRQDEMIVGIRSSPTATVSAEALDALVVPTDATLSKAVAAEASPPAAGTAKPR